LHISDPLGSKTRPKAELAESWSLPWERGHPARRGPSSVDWVDAVDVVDGGGRAGCFRPSFR